MKSISKNLKKTFSDKHNFLLLILIIFHVIFFIIFRILNKNYQTWDSAGHISLSYRMASEIKRLLSGAEGVTIISILKMSNYYPPFVQLTGAITALIFGYKSIFLLTLTLIFFIISIIFTYKLTFLITKNKDVSLLTACIYSLFPQVVDQSHYFHLDIPLIAVLLISIYFLHKSEGFKKFWYTMLFFIFFSISQLIKWYGFVYLMIPVLYYFFGIFIENDDGSVLDNIAIVKTIKRIISKLNIKSARELSEEKGIIISNIIFGSLVFLFISMPWYIINWKDLIGFMSIFSVGESDDPTSLWESIIYYPINAVTYQIMLVPFILLVASLVYSYKKTRKRAILYFLIISVPWVVFIYISNKNSRYILPLVPFFAYLISSISLKISEKVKNFPIYLVVYLLIASTFLSFSHMKKESPFLKFMGIIYAGFDYEAWYYSGASFYSYKPYKYPIDNFIDFIYEDAQIYDNSLGVAVLFDSENMSAATLELVRLENRYDNMYMPVPYFQFEPFRSDEEIEAFFRETSSAYAITSNNAGPEGLRNYRALVQSTEYLHSDRNKMFEKINVFQLPHGEKISVYKRIGDIKEIVSTEGCRFGAGMADGVESIFLKPNRTYIFYTGHFAIQDKIWRDFERGVMYIVQIENTVHESILDVHNLPKSGSSFCNLEGLGMNLLEDVKRALTTEDQCGIGVNCQKVVLVRWSVGYPDVQVYEYTSDSF